MNPCDLVCYRLTDNDAVAVNRRRTDGASISSRMGMTPAAWPQGAQAHIGRPVSGGDVFPMIVVQEADGTISGQVFLTGNDVLWVDDIKLGYEPGTYQMPRRAA